MPTTDDIHNKLTNIYNDFASNVTHIHGRFPVHLAIDLVYHAPLRFVFNNEMIEKAYPEVLIIGDTRVGKSRSAVALMNHYGCGALAQAEAMSYSGLVGGCQKMFEGAWDVTWGKLPQHNRRLVIIDETSGMDEKLLGSLSDIRSSGIATIEKISSQKTEAKTRILWLSNPKKKLMVSQYSSGVSVIETLVSQPEDIARWDMVVIVAREDVPLRDIRELQKIKAPKTHTSDICHSLILWAWTREAHEVIIAKDTVDACFDCGQVLADKYSGEFALVSEAEQPLKLAKFASSLAARLFSTDDGVRLLVRPEHVEYICRFMQEVYDAPNFRYDSWSVKRNAGAKIHDRNEMHEFLKRIGYRGALNLLSLEKMRANDLAEMLGTSRDETLLLLSRLIGNNAIRRFYGDYYHKTKEFNDMLRDYTDRNVEMPTEGEDNL